VNPFDLPTLRVLVTGSRGWTSETKIRAALREVGQRGNFISRTVIVGGAAGADFLAAKAAHELGWTVETHFADWKRNGKAAGAMRNKDMVDSGADFCLAFWDGKSRGTADCFGKAVRAGIPVSIIPPPRSSE